MVAFTQSIRQANFLKEPKKRLVVATVRYTIGYLYQAFEAALRDDPRRDPYGSLSFLLEHIFKEYASKYPGVKQQKAIPIIVLLKVLDLAHTYLATEIADIFCANFFFAM